VNVGDVLSLFEAHLLSVTGGGLDESHNQGEVPLEPGLNQSKEFSLNDWRKWSKTEQRHSFAV
jgi:hypothetical protein